MRGRIILQNVIGGKMKKLMVVLMCLSLCGVSWAQQSASLDSPIIKHDLNGMSNENVKAYFEDCVEKGLIFFYRGGISGWYLLSNEDMPENIENYKWVSIGCTGGVPQGSQFNKLMLEYIKQSNESNRK